MWNYSKYYKQMKHLSIAFATIVVALMASCGNGTPKPSFNNDVDSLSYAIGMANSQGLKNYLVRAKNVDTTYMDDFIRGLNDAVSAGENKKKTAYYAGLEIGQQVTQQIIKGINFDLFGTDSTETINTKNFIAGFVSGTLEKDGLMTMEEAQQVTQELVSVVKAKQMEKIYGEWREQNEEFLANIAKQPGVQKLSDGVYYEVLEEGEGEIPADTSRVEVDYEGKLITDTIFDSTYKRGKPVQFPCSQVVEGWREALTHMPVGSKWKVYISSDKAYGERESGAVKPFSTLVFTIDLKDIVK